MTPRTREIAPGQAPYYDFELHFEGSKLPALGFKRYRISPNLTVRAVVLMRKLVQTLTPLCGTNSGIHLLRPTYSSTALLAVRMW